METAQPRKLSQFSLPVVFLSSSGPFLSLPSVPPLLCPAVTCSLLASPTWKPGGGCVEAPGESPESQRELSPFLFKKPSSETRAFSMAEDFSVCIQRDRHHALRAGAGAAGVGTRRASPPPPRGWGPPALRSRGSCLAQKRSWSRCGLLKLP